MDVSIRPLTNEDLEIADRIVTSAFDLSESRGSEMRRYFGLRPNAWFLAFYKDKPAGVVGATDYGPFTYLGMMTVRKDLQRKGIGKALLRHMLNWTEGQGISFLRLDASEAGFPLYRRFGFEVFDQSLLFELPDYSPPPNLPGQVQPLLLRDIQVLADFDGPIFGADRTHLFKALFTDFPGRSFAAYDGIGHMTGYLFAQSRQLGPWATQSLQDAEALLRAALRLPFEAPPLVIAPRINREAANLLKRFGFRLKLANRHMQRGKSTLPGKRTSIYGITSFAVG